VENPFLSIIIPAFNEEKRLPNTLETVFEFLRNQSYSSEVIVVDNGSWDKTLVIAQSFQNENKNLRVIHESERGKGLAVQKGMQSAAGEYLFMCDADLSMPIEEISRFLPPDGGSHDIVIASREAPGAVRYNEPGFRHWGGRGVNLMIRLFAIPGIHDTQCGFKMFSFDAAQNLFNLQTLNNWSFDIEILFIALRRGYKIKEIPIPWYFNPDTKLSPLKDALQMAIDIAVIHRNAYQGVYDQKG